MLITNKGSHFICVTVPGLEYLASRKIWGSVQFLYMAAVVSVISRHGLSIDEHCRNQLNKSKLAL